MSNHLTYPLVQQLIDTLTLEKTGEDVFVGQSYDYVGKRIFGGQVLGQALMAALNTIDDEDKPCHSFHCYFLRGGSINQPVEYQVRRLRDGRSLSARQVTAVQYKENQHGEQIEQVIFSMLASFAPMEGGLEYQDTMPVYPPPEDLQTEQQLKENVVGNVPEALQERFMRKRHIEIRPVTPRDPVHPKPMRPKQANWLRLADLEALGEQPFAVHQALLAFASDFYLVGTGLMPHGVSFMTKGLQAASIDHSMHFHRPFKFNEWLLYDMWSDTTSHAKGLNHGQFWQNGKLVATTQQEGLMRLRG